MTFLGLEGGDLKKTQRVKKSTTKEREINLSFTKGFFSLVSIAEM
jgi:hypothetical protein